MGSADIIATIGVSIFLAAFVLNVAGRLATDNGLYLWMNLVGALLACAASVLISFYPFVVLEGAWAAAATIGLIRQHLARERASA